MVAAHPMRTAIVSMLTCISMLSSFRMLTVCPTLVFVCQCRFAVHEVGDEHRRRRQLLGSRNMGFSGNFQEQLSSGCSILPVSPQLFRYLSAYIESDKNTEEIEHSCLI